MAAHPTQCDHAIAKCVESTEPKDKGKFREEYECPCGATGTIVGREEEPPHKWDRRGQVFEDY